MEQAVARPEAFPWDIQPDEDPGEFAVFLEYLHMGVGRSLAKVHELLVEQGREPESLRTFERYSSKGDWPARAGAYDVAVLTEESERRTVIREATRQKFFREADHAADVIIAGLDGEFASDGRMEPVLNRQGEKVGDRPVFSPVARYQHAKFVLAVCGINEPKRVELTGADGKDLKISARLGLEGISDEQLELARKMFPVD